MSNWKEYKRITNNDSTRYVSFQSEPGGLFTWEEYRHFVDEYSEGWTPCGAGGLYNSANDVERAARSGILWLQSENSN
jgi:hypothetical protein